MNGKTKYMVRLFTGTAGLAGMLVGCGAGVFNPAFVNTVTGGAFPLTPGPRGDFVFARALNETGQNAEFIITIEREEVERDDFGNPLVDDLGAIITRPVRETVRLNTLANAPANELGVLFPCETSAVNIIGLGADLLPDDIAVFLGGQGAGGAAGFGIPAGGLSPLSRAAGNFSCGDTIIFRAIQARGLTGGVKLESFLLPGSAQPSVFTGPNTFVNYQQFLASQVREDE